MKKIKLTSQGKFAVIDDDDFERVNNFKWYAYNSDGIYYAGRTLPGNFSISMHRYILNAPSQFYVDHKNRDGLDNRKTNIRLCTASQNQANRIVSPKNKTGFKGVSYHIRDKKWHSRIRLSGELFHLGTFSNPIEAAKMYDRKAIELFGEFARLNFDES